MSTGAGLAFWLYRPYLDLGPGAPRPPHHVSALDYGYRSVVERRAYPRIQASLNPSFREVLTRQGRLPAYDVARPADLAPELRTPRWQELCAWSESFADLDVASQGRVAWLLAKLCFFREVERLIPASALDDCARSPDHAALAYVRSWSRCRLNLDDASHPYALAEFERIAREAPIGIAQVDAYYQLVSQSVKYAGDLAATERWQPELLASIERYRPEIDDYDWLLLMSRYHRVGGFIPQMRREKEGVIREMQLSEDYARAMPREDEPRAVGADEMLFPVLESRIKEALWLGDHAKARARAIEITTLAPHDSRAWLHRGQVHVDGEDLEEALAAYQTSARYSPPGREVACFMAGQCHEALGDPEAACDAYVASLDADPLAIGSAEALATVAEEVGARSLAAWAAARTTELRALEAVTIARKAEPYRSFAPPAAEVRS